MNTLALAFALIAFPIPPQAVATLPDGCTITLAVDDGVYATCDNGIDIYYDADGQSYPNEYGQPTRPPGWIANTWEKES